MEIKKKTLWTKQTKTTIEKHEKWVKFVLQLNVIIMVWVFLTSLTY